MTNESYIKKYVFINTEEMTRIYSVFEGNPSEIFLFCGEPVPQTVIDHITESGFYQGNLNFLCLAHLPSFVRTLRYFIDERFIRLVEEKNKIKEFIKIDSYY